MLKANKIGAVSKKGKIFVACKISKALREDYERYLMGQDKIIYIAPKRKMTEYQVTRVFNILFQEKINDHMRITGKLTA